MGEKFFLCFWRYAMVIGVLASALSLAVGVLLFFFPKLLAIIFAAGLSGLGLAVLFSILSAVSLR